VKPMINGPGGKIPLEEPNIFKVDVSIPVDVSKSTIDLPRQSQRPRLYAWQAPKQRDSVKHRQPLRRGKFCKPNPRPRCGIRERRPWIGPQHRRSQIPRADPGRRYFNRRRDHNQIAFWNCDLNGSKQTVMCELLQESTNLGLVP